VINGCKLTIKNNTVPSTEKINPLFNEKLSLIVINEELNTKQI